MPGDGRRRGDQGQRDDGRDDPSDDPCPAAHRNPIRSDRVARGTAPGADRIPAVFNARMDRRELRGMLAEGGFLAPDEEADELITAAAGDGPALDAMVRRRLTGEPLAWITGSVEFCGGHVRVDPGVFVPRWHTEPLVVRAAELLPSDGIGVDVCTGSGAVARVMATHRPKARVVGTDVDAAAVTCAR